MAGTHRYCPVSGGERPSSRAMWARTAAMLPPAEPPPTMKPVEGSAPRVLAFSAAYVSMKRQSQKIMGLPKYAPDICSPISRRPRRR
jgi:hypothetical protein